MRGRFGNILRVTTSVGQQLSLWDSNHSAVDGAWRVRRSARARRLGLRVFRDGAVEVVVPLRVGAQQIQSFVTRHRAWIERQRQRMAPVDGAFPPATIELRALGESWPAAAGEDRAALLQWLMQRARDTLVPRLIATAQTLGCAPRRVQIRQQRTRWGSCSARGTISLNSCLLFQRPAVVSYLFVHELAHLTHMNHSARFWELVERYEPNWRQLDRELNQGWRQVPGWVLAGQRRPT